MPTPNTSLTSRPSAWLPALCFVLLAVGAACSGTADKLLTVTTPSRLQDEQFLVPQNASLIVASAVTDFECALGSYVVASGLAAGELTDASQTASRWAYDRRDVLPGDAQYSTSTCVSLGVYTPISTARFTNDQALSKLDSWTDAQVPNRSKLLGTAALYAGYSYVLLAEGFCTAAVNVGPELSTTQLLDSAEARFTRAITLAQSTNDQTVLNAAYVGRARVRLDKGNKTGAADDAGKVPLSFALNASADVTSGRRNNRIYAENNSGANGVTVAVAYRNLTVNGVPDPRVKVVDNNRPNGDQVNRWWVQQKYGSLTAPTPIATGVEAQLILAEAQGGTQGTTILNNLRARPGVGLPALTPAEVASFQNTILTERARELFLQGNRWFDERRASIPQTPTQGTPYPKGGQYGSQRCWPLPDVERAANPNLS
jgi:hypothetical protein